MREQAAGKKSRYVIAPRCPKHGAVRAYGYGEYECECHLSVITEAALRAIEDEGMIAQGMDPEVIDTVRALNALPFMETFDSCFGHSSRTCNHHSEVFIGISPKAGHLDAFRAFWEAFFKRYSGKPRLATGWVQFTVVGYLFGSSGGLPNMMRVHVSPEHDPHSDPRGAAEKIEGLALLRKYAEDYPV